MAQNKLKQKVEGLTNVIRQLVKEVQRNADIAQGTLTALQIHVGEEDWNKIVEELKDKEKRAQNVEQKLEKGN
jgi:predicted CopG family antitoxin|tara:strand:- start:271 stop:489 length:219 start_codon:yes stop_codon:yes gene_type:complete